MIFKETFSSHDYDGLIAYSGDDISDEMIEKCFELDKCFFNDEYLNDTRYIKSWIKNESRLCFIIYNVNNNSLVGYSFLFPISKDIKDKYVNGYITFLDMKENDTLTMKENSAYNLFWFSQAFYPGYKISNLQKIINEIILKTVLSLAKNNNIAIKGILYDSVCKYDEMVMSALDLDNVGTIKSGAKVFYSEFIPEKIFKNTYASSKVKYFYELDKIKDILNHEQ